MVKNEQTLNTVTLIVDGEQLACEYLIRPKTVVVLHGAGTSGKDRYYEFTRQALDLGLGVVIFDFSGHGDSTGTISKLSLQRRFVQAQGVISALCKDTEIYLAGFSMGGQTTVDVIENNNEDAIKGVLLGCAAIYDSKVREMPFGDKAFTETIRRPRSWKNSNVGSVLENYQGKILVVIGENDDVIPKQVTEMYATSRLGSDLLTYPSVSHQLVKWLNAHPSEWKNILIRLTT